MFNVLKFYSAHGVDHITSGHKRARKGWVQIHCPFCRRSYALGVNLTSGGVKCWVCGKHSQLKLIQALLNCSANQAFAILEKFEGRPVLRAIPEDAIRPQVRRQCAWPLGTVAMEQRHRSYLEKRRYDAERLESIYDLRGTGPVGEYNHRIIIPICLEGRMISFQGRDITGKCEDHDKYRACAQKDEAQDHKSSLYAIDLVPGDSAVVVEGAADCWRLGPGAVGTFGTGFTRRQQHLFRRKFKRAFMLFDPEPIATAQAERCAHDLAILGTQVELITLDGDQDPGDLPQDEADAIMRELLGKGAGWR